MKVIIYIGLVLVNSLIVFFLWNQVFLLWYNGVKVEYQRVTGPEFIVIKGHKYLENGIPDRKNIDFNELYITNDLDKRIGYLKEGNYVIYGKVLGTKTTMDGGKNYPLMKVELIVSTEEFYIKSSILILSILSFCFLAYKIVRSIV